MYKLCKIWEACPSGHLARSVQEVRKIAENTEFGTVKLGFYCNCLITVVIVLSEDVQSLSPTRLKYVGQWNKLVCLRFNLLCVLCWFVNELQFLVIKWCQCSNIKQTALSKLSPFLFIIIIITLRTYVTYYFMIFFLDLIK